MSKSKEALGQGIRALLKNIDDDTNKNIKKGVEQQDEFLFRTQQKT